MLHIEVEISYYRKAYTTKNITKIFNKKQYYGDTMKRKNQKKSLVLVVDDDINMRKLACRTLKEASFEVEVAVNGEEALSLFKFSQPDIVLVDVMMPGMDGFSLCAALRSMHRGKHIPILMITGAGDIQSIKRAYEVGATDFVSKPFNWLILIQRLQYMLRASNAFKKLRKSESCLAKSQRIAHLGSWEFDVDNNILTCSEETYRIYNVEHQKFNKSYEEFLRFVYPSDQKKILKYINEAIFDAQPFQIDHRIVLSDGQVRVVSQQVEVTCDDTGRTVNLIGTVQDITQRNLSEKKLRAALKEKDALLREIHHRVKNNMQVISSLLKLQSRYIKDKDAQEMYTESQNRIQSMALIHEKLYQSENLSRINFSDYISNLSQRLFSFYGISSYRINFSINAHEVWLSIHDAIPCGLIINELLSNSLKHAFPEGREGEIKIVLRVINDSHVEFIFSDNGIGLPEDINIEETDTLGLQLVSILTQQLDGTITIDRKFGTTFTITFKKKNVNICSQNNKDEKVTLRGN
jgi:two-component sensor histidine kinase/DNA-binding response OmpR family regulator